MAKIKYLFLLFTLLLFNGLPINAYAGPVCGDGVVEGDEQCDTVDIPTDICDENCMTIAPPVCGNGVVEGTEQCDDLNLPTETCDANCQTIPGGGNGNVEIDGCDTGIPDSGSIQASIDACAANAKNHGDFVRCVAIYTNSLRSEGVITRNERKPIMTCSAQSDIGR